MRLGGAHLGHGCAHLLRLRGLPALNKGTILDTSRSKALSAAKDSKVVTRAYPSKVIWLRTPFT